MLPVPTSVSSTGSPILGLPFNVVDNWGYTGNKFLVRRKSLMLKETLLIVFIDGIISYLSINITIIKFK